MRCSEILLPARLAPGQQPGVSIAVAKTGLHQFARLTMPVSVALLELLCAEVASDDLLFPFPPAHMNAVLHRAVSALGLPGSFTMHCTRHGKAASCHLAGVPPETIRLLGRWASPRSMEIYLQAVCSALTALHLPVHLRLAVDLVSVHVGMLPAVFAQLPALLLCSRGGAAVVTLAASARSPALLAAASPGFTAAAVVAAAGCAPPSAVDGVSLVGSRLLLGADYFDDVPGVSVPPAFSFPTWVVGFRPGAGAAGADCWIFLDHQRVVNYAAWPLLQSLLEAASAGAV
jgi:hypothetical protein